VESSFDLDAQVRRVKQGDIDAYAEIVRICEHAIRGWVVSRCPPELR
jgi:hypothetical protein